MTDSYININTTEAKRLAGDTVALIEAERRGIDKKRANVVIGRREKLRRFFRWLKPMSFEQARLEVLRKGMTTVTYYWTPYNRSKAILNLAKSAGSDPSIYICSADLEHIQFAERYAKDFDV